MIERLLFQSPINPATYYALHFAASLLIALSVMLLGASFLFTVAAAPTFPARYIADPDAVT